MKNKKTIIIILGITAIITGIMVQSRKKTVSDQTQTTLSETAGIQDKTGTSELGSQVPEVNTGIKTNGACFRNTYQHLSKNRNRDLEEFMNDLNAFQMDDLKINPGSVCVKVNHKPVNHKIVKTGNRKEVLIGSVVGPESIIEVLYCIGETTCKETCKVSNENKVDELLNENEIAGIENKELEDQVKELRKIASNHEEIYDSAVIRDWNKLDSQEWKCTRN